MFAGVSLEGSVIFTRNDANEKLYGDRVSAKELLNGTVPPPHEADSLYRALNAKFHTLGNGMSAMYQRRLEQDENNARLQRSTTISAPGTLRIPGVRAPVGGYGAPNVSPTPSYENNTNIYSTSAPSAPCMGYAPSKQYSNNEYGYNNVNPTAPPPSYDNQQRGYGLDIKVAPPPPVPSQHSKPIKARALYAFTGQEHGDLTFNEGDVFIVTEKTDSHDDWWTGRLNGQLGSVRYSYFILQRRYINLLY